jgi:TM2 domain-containing membrane protein YozV
MYRNSASGHGILLLYLYCTGTPGIFSILETLKRHKRQTATQRDKSALVVYQNRY